MTTAGNYVERIGSAAASVNFRVVIPVLWVMEKEYGGSSNREFLSMQYLPVTLQDVKDGPPNPKLLLVGVVPAEPGGV